jgi:hypothetical protein
MGQATTVPQRVSAMPTSLDDGQRSPKKLLADVVRKLVAALKR